MLDPNENKYKYDARYWWISTPLARRVVFVLILVVVVFAVLNEYFNLVY
ncbi:hypothetical protein VP395_10885 [Mariniflexile soesokkakense]|uniref:Uncharacterized protein n=1 Tax=Mariniflexile soesokkakense TaxID=1343160 RepID=A0ABV0AAV0_9FLAO